MSSDKTDRAKGKAKEVFGEASGDERLFAEGRRDQARGDCKAAGNKMTDALRNSFRRSR